MAKGFDELIDFLLAEIALCGVQGTYSAALSLVIPLVIICTSISAFSFCSFYLHDPTIFAARRSSFSLFIRRLFCFRVRVPAITFH